MLEPSGFKEPDLFPKCCFIFKRYWNIHTKFHIDTVFGIKYFKELFLIVNGQTHMSLGLGREKRVRILSLGTQLDTKWKTEKSVLLMIIASAKLWDVESGTFALSILQANLG